MSLTPVPSHHEFWLIPRLTIGSKVTPEVRRICGECEVGKQCEVDALRNGDIGIRNGKTTNEREAQERLKEQQIRRVTGRN